MNDATVLELRSINKAFGPTQANKDVSMTLAPAEVRGLVGENGSGKSTLLSILAGTQQKDSGEMVLQGEPYEPTNLQYANRRGIGMVVQELGLVESLPGYLNMYFGRTHEASHFGIMSTRKLKEMARRELEKHGFEDVPVEIPASDLSCEERKIVELARALSGDPQIIILDELTQALSFNSRARLYDLIKKLSEAGKSVILVSHDLEEVLEVTDTVTIMRDGEVVGTKVSVETSEDDLRYMMIGRDLRGEYFRSDNEASYDDDVIMEVRGLRVEGCVEDVSFDLHRGEILAFCGLSDAGIHAVGKAVFGTQPRQQGVVRLPKRDVTIQSPLDAISHGVGYVPKDRDIEGLMLGDSVRENLCLPSIPSITKRFGYLGPSELNRYAQRAVDAFEIKATGIGQIVNSLSGGNKQKVNLSRWMTKDLEILLLDTATRGVDVGVKAYIYQRMIKAKSEGISIVLFSDELPEALGMADRILVMKNGRIEAEFRRGTEFSEEAIIGVML